ncbi:hypothetical protein GE061_004351 [Apolygus lucorum]|uniref:Trichohyalin-plectin-homology domain-containing protein n=1 Tax=Apolygus lucorum TaxID=248454 RepID=A0A8S9X2X9_APOLU|nr:hypothetical protein GE061_004351 [Apolygus lucorum]
MKSTSRVERKIPGDRQAVGGFGDVGYIMKRPGHGYKTEKFLEHQANVRNEALKTKKGIKNLKNERTINEYYRKFDTITVQASVNRAVQLGMDQLEREMVGKQNRLKSILLGEQSDQLIEYTRKAQEYEDERKDAMRRKAEEIQKKRDDSDRRMAQEAYTRIALENSDEYKSKLSMEQWKIGQEVNKEVIRLKLLQKMADAECEAIWNAEAEKCGQAVSKEDAKAEAARKAGKTTHYQNLNKQIEEQKRIRKNEECIEEMNAQRRKVVQDEEYRKLDLRHEQAKQREQLGFKFLTQQIGENKVLAARNRQEEIMVDKITLDYNRKVLQKEQAAIRDDRAQSWNELVIFKQSMVEYRNAWLARAKESERLEEKYDEEIRQKKYKAWKAKQDLRKDLSSSCFESAKRRLEENLVKEAANKQKESKAGALVNHYNAINSKLSSAKKLMALNRAPYYDESVKYLKILQERQRLEDQEVLENMRKQNEERQREVTRVLERPVQEAFKHQHPMYRVLKSE